MSHSDSCFATLALTANLSEEVGTETAEIAIQFTRSVITLRRQGR